MSNERSAGPVFLLGLGGLSGYLVGLGAAAFFPAIGFGIVSGHIVVMAGIVGAMAGKFIVDSTGR